VGPGDAGHRLELHGDGGARLRLTLRTRPTVRPVLARAGRWVAVAGAALALAPAASARQSEAGLAFVAGRVAPRLPSFLSQTYDDGTIALRYPRGWIVNRTERFGVVLSDNKSAHPAFLGIQYLPRRTYGGGSEFADVAGRVLRPPDGRHLTLLYTQAAVVGGLRGTEAAFMWAYYTGGSPLGPTMRVVGTELPSGRVAILVFAAERPRLHNGQFSWIKKTIRWADAADAGA